MAPASTLVLFNKNIVNFTLIAQASTLVLFNKNIANFTPMIAPASTLVLFNKNIVNFTHNHQQSQYSKIFEFFDRTFS